MSGDVESRRLLVQELGLGYLLSYHTSFTGVCREWRIRSDGRGTVSLASGGVFSIQMQSAVSSVEFAIATWGCATNVPGISVEGLIEECEEMQQVIVSQGELGLFSRPISVTDPPQVCG